MTAIVVGKIYFLGNQEIVGNYAQSVNSSGTALRLNKIQLWADAAAGDTLDLSSYISGVSTVQGFTMLAVGGTDYGSAMAPTFSGSTLTFINTGMHKIELIAEMT